MTELHGELKDADAFFDNRVGFFVPSLTTFVDSLKAEGLPFHEAEKHLGCFLGLVQ